MTSAAQPSTITSLITLSGMTCSGKSTLANKLIATGFFARVITATTRAPRRLKQGTETHGIDYLFLSDRDFDTLEQSGALLESTRFADFRYGTPKESLLNIQAQGQLPLIITDPTGAMSLKHLGKRMGWDVLNIYLDCDIRTAIARLDARAQRYNLKDSDYYRARIDALTCEESGWSSQYPWDLSLQQFSEENFSWQLGLILNNCRDGQQVADQRALSAIDQPH